LEVAAKSQDKTNFNPMIIKMTARNGRSHCSGILALKRTDQETAQQYEIHVAEQPVSDAGHGGERDRVGKVGADDFQRAGTRVEEQQRHGAECAGTY
jgi:hypothetical protein